jgi:hypothetical protein
MVERSRSRQGSRAIAAGIRRTLIALALAALAYCSSAAAAEQRVLHLVSVDPPGTNGSLEVLGPNMGFITPPIVLTPDGKTAAYRALTNIQYQDSLFKSSGGRTELVGVGPKGVAAGTVCSGEHYDCSHRISPDGKRVVFETRTSLVNADADSGCYFSRCDDVYDRVGGVTSLLSTVDPGGGNGPFEARLGSLSPDGSHVYFNLGGSWERAEDLSPFPSPETQATSATVHREGASPDGRRVFFSTDDSLLPEDADGCGGEYFARGCTDVYQRTSRGALKLVSTGPVSEDGALDARFGGASADGSRVFFTTREKLVPEDTDQCSDRGCTDVYERSDGVTRLISVGPTGGGRPAEAEFDAVSADGRSVFFSTEEPLVPEDTDSCPDYRGPGCVDVYELRYRALRLVSTGPGGGNASTGATFDGISKDGSHVFFSTRESLVPEDNYSCPDWSQAVPGCIDIYQRSANVTRLISTGPASPNGDNHAWFGGASDDGKRVIFTTTEPLVPEDTDHCFDYSGFPSGCPDIYEGSGGVTSLVSRGTVKCNNSDFGDPPYCPVFVGASTDGRRVFFVTQESLVPEDTDTGNDLYVSTVSARACRPDKPGKRPKKCGF